MENTEPTTSVSKAESEGRSYYVAQPDKGYKVHPLDELVDARMKTVRFTNEDGSVTKARMEVPYKKPRYERYVPIVNLGKTYPSHSKKRGGASE